MGKGIILEKGEPYIQVIESLFEEALKLESPWKITKVDLDTEQGKITIWIDFSEGSLFRCSRCGNEATAYDTKEKVWRHLNFFQYECYLVVRVPRTDCKEDGALQVEVPWARQSTDWTLLFESLAMVLCREMPVNKVSKILGVDDNKLWRMMTHYTDAARQLSDYSGVSAIGADETSKAKGHDYVTLFVDLRESRTLFVAEGKGADTVKGFKADLIAHGGASDNIEEASIDMSPAFIKGLTDNFPTAEITFDKFHIMKVINKAVDTVRKEESKTNEILRGQRYLFLKNRDNLTVAQADTLREIESMPRLNLKTVKAYHLRENFQEIYKEPTKEGFEEALKKWYFWATHSRIEPMKEAAKTIRAHWAGVLRWNTSKVSNGILEGLNSLIQAAKAKARGYRTFKNLRTIIYMLTGKLDFTKVGLPT
jgi:transposase